MSGERIPSVAFLIQKLKFFMKRVCCVSFSYLCYTARCRVLCELSSELCCM